MWSGVKRQHRRDGDDRMQREQIVRRIAIVLGFLVAGCGCGFALNPSLDMSQYARTSWTVRDGFSLGSVFAMAQTPDGYLWLGSEFGLFRFDGVRFISWQPPAGQHLPQSPYSLIVTRDGTLWIGTFAGLVSWNGAKLTRYPQLDGLFVTSLLEDRQGTVWAGTLGGSPGTPTGRLCAIRSGSAHCYLEDGAFGSFVWSLGEDSSGTLWAGAESGLWRWKPGSPRRYATPALSPLENQICRALPTRSGKGTAPNLRESVVLSPLSPSKKICPGGTVTSRYCAGGVFVPLHAPATLARLLRHHDPLAVDGLFPRQAFAVDRDLVSLNRDMVAGQADHALDVNRRAVVRVDEEADVARLHAAFAIGAVVALVGEEKVAF